MIRWVLDINLTIAQYNIIGGCHCNCGYGGLIGGGMTTVTTASDKGVSGGHAQGAMQ